MKSLLFILLVSRVRGDQNPVSQAPRTALVIDRHERRLSLANVVDVGAHNTHATPVFWHVPKAGGTTVSDLLASCLQLTVAAEVGILGGHDMDTRLESVDVEGLSYVNVDTTTIRGIQRAQEMGFANAQPASVVITSYLREATTQLFTPDHPATLFTLLRHPVPRAVSMFYYLQEAHWEKDTYHPEWANMTILEYAKSEFAEHNWMIQFLVGKPYVTSDDLEDAKAILSKMYIGFVTNMENSLQRFGKAFGWSEFQAWSNCMEISATIGSNQHNHSHVKPNSEEWNALFENNQLDAELFSYAEQLYEEQGKLYFKEVQ
jgi:hypothetical protein